MLQSKTAVLCLAVVIFSTVSKAENASPFYQATGACEMNQVCIYKYTAEQQQFGSNQEQAISIGATVDVFCNSVGIHNGTAATEYCMEVLKVSLEGFLFADTSSERRELEEYVNQKLAGTFCFVQTVSGKVASVFHNNGESYAVNLKKSIAAAFQANFKGTKVEEEIDPQSKHISHYSYTSSEEEGVQKMHRSINSEDVEEYPNDDRPHEVELHKEEDIEYHSGILQSSSGVTSIAIDSHQQRSQKPLGSEESSGDDQDDSNVLSVKGSYRLDREHCYTPSESEIQRRKRSSDNVFESALSATIDKRAIARQHLEELRQLIPSPLQVLVKLHREPENIHLASKLQQLLVFEAEYGPLTRTTPALIDVLYYLKKVNQSHDPRYGQIKHTIYSLLAHEGTLKSQLALFDALIYGNDQEQDSVITHISFIENAHIDFIKKLETILNKKGAKSYSLLLAYSALASTASGSVQQHIVDFLKERLSQHMEVNDTSNTVHLLHAFGNTGSERIIDLLLDYYWHSDSEEVKLAAIGGMRKLTDHELVQDAFVTILQSTPDEIITEEIAKTLLSGWEYLNLKGVQMSKNTPLLNALVDTCLLFRNNTQLHILVYSYLQAINTAMSHRLAEFLLQQTGSTRIRRESTTDWDASNSLYNHIASHASRRSDVNSYSIHKAYLWGRRLGSSKVNVELAAGTFAGGSSTGGKMFGKAIAKGNLFGRSATIGEAIAEASTENFGVKLKLYAKIAGNVLVDYHKTQSCCITKSWPLHSSRYRIIRFQHSVFVYVAILSVYVEMNAYLLVNLNGEICVGSPLCSGSSLVRGRISLTPEVQVVPEGGASLSVVAATIGLRLRATFRYQLEPVGTAHVCANPSLSGSCSPAFKACAELYHVFPTNYLDLFVWYQNIKVKWCKKRWLPKFPCGITMSSQKKCCFSKRWNLSGERRTKIWGQCATR